MSVDSDRAARWENGSSGLFEEARVPGSSSNGSGSGSGSGSGTGTGGSPLDSPLDLGRAVPLGVVLGAFIAFAVAGNVLVILSVVCNKHLRVPTNYFIINLAIADLLLGTTVLPVSATLEVLGRWVFGRIFCDIWAALDVLCCTASIMSLCAISIDRYIGVRYPLQYPSIVTERRALTAMLGVWVLSVVISIGPLLGWKEPPSPDETVCPITEEPFYALFSSLGSFYIPLAVILAMYCRVYIVAKRTTRNLEAGVMKERMDSNELTLRIHHKSSQAQEDAAHPAKSSLAVKLFKFSREKKAAKTLGVVVGMFVLCWLPFFLVLPMGSFNRSLRPPDTCFKVIFWLGYFNSCLNPIIYPCYNREFHQAFVRILRCQCRRRKRPDWAAYDHRSPRLAPTNRPHKESLDEHSACLNGSQRTLSSAEASPGCASNSPEPAFEASGPRGWPPSSPLPGSSMGSQWDLFGGSSDESTDEHSGTSSIFHDASESSFTLPNGQIRGADSERRLNRTDSQEKKTRPLPV